jgi:hypothetical protein
LRRSAVECAREKADESLWRLDCNNKQSGAVKMSVQVLSAMAIRIVAEGKRTSRSWRRRRRRKRGSSSSGALRSFGVAAASCDAFVFRNKTGFL